MENLRPTNSRTTIVVDPAAQGVADPARVFVGRPEPLGRARLLYALPLDPGPALLSAATLIRAPGAALIADPQGTLPGEAPVWVSRMLTVLPTEDTRGLGGGSGA